MTLLRLFAIFSVLLISSQAFCEKGMEYYTIDEYFKINKQQKELTKIFSEKVTEKSKPIRKRFKSPIRIAVVYPAIQQSSYWRDSVKSMTARLDESGIKYELLKYYSRPSGNYRLQAMHLNEASKGNMDYIILSVDNSNVRRLIPALLTKDKPKIMIQNLTTPIKNWDAHKPFMYVGFDHIEGSKMIAEHYSKMFPEGANYLLLYGSKGTVSTLRGGGFESYGLSKGFVPVAKYYTDFDFQKSYKATKSALKNTIISDLFTHAQQT